jgi:hypothetical protein
VKTEAINEIVNLIRAGLPLPDDHCVTYNQMVPMPPDKTMFVAVGILDSKPFAGSLSYGAPARMAKDEGVTAGPGLLERQTLNIREVLSIHLMSRDNSAREGRWSLIFALTNTRAVQAMEARGFMIARLPVGFVDASVTEAAERLNRFVCTMVVLYAKAREGAVDYYDHFGSGNPQLVINR